MGDLLVPVAEWLGRLPSPEVLRTRAWEHLVLTVVPIVYGLAIAFPLALTAARWPRLYGPLLGSTGVMFTIPSIALFILLMPFTGLTRVTSIVGLTLYTLLVLLRNIVEGLRGVSPDVREAAEAMGFRRARMLFTVELPLALPVIFAGIRIATVTTIGLVVVTAVIGQGGLGRLIFDGMVLYRTPWMWAGFVLCVAYAVLADVALAGLQRLLTPWTRRAV